MNSQPALEIYADDVKCTHGSTTGPVDEEMVFYLRSRGVGLEAARHLLTYAFAADITRRSRSSRCAAGWRISSRPNTVCRRDLRITDLGEHDEKAAEDGGTHMPAEASILSDRRTPVLDVEEVRHQFPILGRKVHGKPLVYFDNAATTQKPQSSSTRSGITTNPKTPTSIAGSTR